MKLLYGDNLVCSTPTMKRLMIMADEIGFMDRPAIGHDALGGGQWGLIGTPSPIRQFSTEGQPVKLVALDAPLLASGDIYASYIRADFENPEFVRTILHGLSNDAFAEKLIQLGANYGSGMTGETVRQALLKDDSLQRAQLTPAVDGRLMFKVESSEGRQTTLKISAIEVSVRLTTTMLASEQYDIPPVSDDPVFAKLLAMRSSSNRYIGGSAPLAPYLGFEMVKAVIPDALLQDLTVADILGYRQESKAAYAAWDAEINRFAARLDDVDPTQAELTIPKLIAEELMPRIIECRNEMQSVRDKLFQSLVRRITTFQFPTTAIAYYHSGNLVHAVMAFLASAAPAIVQPFSDYAAQRRAMKRKHAVSYLVGISHD